MNRRTMLRSLICAGSFPLFGTADQTDTQREFTIRSNVRLVLLDVAVLDSKGLLVSGLAKNNFAVFENGRRQALTVFGHDDLPVTVGLLVDESFSMRPKRSEVLAAAEVFIGGSNRNDEIFVLNFNDSVNRGLPSGVLFSGDLQKLRGALHHGIPQGKTRLNDAVAEGLNILEKGRYEKKALVLITDGGDTASEHTRRQVMDRLERSTATLYAIGIYDEGDPDRDPAFLKKLCSVSGSEAYFPKPEGTAAVCRRIAADIRARYTVGYIPSRGNGESLRNVRVQAAAQHLGHLRAVTRTRYFHDTGE